MAKSEETRYFAQGPTDGWPGFECYGNISIGVGVIGSKCGVFRQSEDYAGKFSSLTDTTSARSSTGVHGRGIDNGTLGEGTLRGVYGIGTPEAEADSETGSAYTTGVLGVGERQCPGVVGLCFSTDRDTSEDPKKEVSLGNKSGVIGASNANSLEVASRKELGLSPISNTLLSAGVVGLSLKEIKAAPAVENVLISLPDPKKMRDCLVMGRAFGE
jgi:hypothetical protein